MNYFATVLQIYINMKQIVLLITFFSFSIAYGQLKGKVIDRISGNAIPFATIQFLDLSTGASTNDNGVFSVDFNIPWHSKIKVSSVGYIDTIIEIKDDVDRGDLKVFLVEKHYHLHEAVVSAGTGVIQDYTITNVVSAPMDELTIIKPVNIGDAITNLAGVYNASTGNAIYKPVIRGLSGIRVLSFLNGVRIENQQWGGDHGLGIGNVGIGNVEVIKGPSSLLYGADALGGVLYLTDEPFAGYNEVDAKVSSQFSSNTNGLDNSFQFKINKGGLRFNGFLSHQDHADYQMPDGDYVKNSRYKGIGGKFLLGFNRKIWVTKLGYNFSQGRISLPGHTHDSVSNLSSFISSEQGRRKSSPAQVINNHFVTWDNQFFFHNADLKLTLGQQVNQLQEFEKLTIPEIDMNLNTSTYYLRYRYNYKTFDIIAGAQGMYQTNANAQGIPEELIPNYNNLDNGVFTVLSGKKGKLNYQMGARYDSRLITTSGNAIDSLNRAFNYAGFNYSGGLSYVTNKYAFRFNVSSGTRMPHVSELLSDGVHHASNRYEIGSLNLLAEQGNQIDMAVELNNEHVNLIFNPFFNVINNYTYLNPIDTVIEGNQAFEYEQASRAYLMGGDIMFHWHPHFLHDFHLESNLSFLYAEDKNKNPLSFIPQTRLTNVLRYSFDYDKQAKFTVSNVSLQYQLFQSQNRVVDYELKSNGYQLVNVGTNAKWKLNNTYEVDVSFGIRNLFNSAYIDHLSALKRYDIPGQGRNIYLSLGFNLNQKI